MIEAKCGAPAFRIKEAAGVNYEEFLIYWLEYDSAKIKQANSGFDPNADFSTRGAMGIKAGMARNDQIFQYIGKNADKKQGYPGFTGSEPSITYTTFEAIECSDWDIFWKICDYARQQSTQKSGSSPSEIMNS